MVAYKIKHLREQLGLTQSDLAKKLGITRSSVNAWELGISVPSTQYVVELAAIFKVSTDYLITGAPRPEDAPAVEQMLAGRLAAVDSLLDQRSARPFSREELAVLFAALLMESP